LSVKVTDLNGFTVFSGPISITVNSDPIATLQATPLAIDIGQNVTFTITATGGTGSFSYSYQTLPSGCSSSDTSRLICKPSQGGLYTVQIVATDQVGGTAMSSVTLPVNPDETIISFLPANLVLDVGQSMQFSVAASAGTGPPAFFYTGLPPGCASSNTSGLICIPSASGDYSVIVTVQDEAGWKVSSSAKLIVNPDPKVAAFTSTLYDLDVGQNILIAVSANGGTGQLSYTYGGLLQACATANTATFPCTPANPGTYIVTVTVTDTLGGYTSSSITIKVNPNPSIATFTASNPTLDQGQSLTLNVAVNGGTEPISYSYSGLPPGCSSTDSATLSCAPSTTGTYQVQVTVTDQASKTSTSSLSLKVNPQTLFGLPLLVGYSVISGIVVAALALSIGILRSRRTRAQSKSSS
jgi:hypothetical protein